MSILFKGNLEEGNYTLIKSTDGWVLKGKTSYAGFNFADRPQGEWIPCSERLPKASITAPCLMTIVFPRAQAVGVAYGYRYHDDVWEYATFEGYEYTENGVAEVVAWMPQPKPWKGANNELV